MKASVAAVAFLLASSAAAADCDAIKGFVREAGISGAGFLRDVSPTSAPPLAEWAKEDMVAHILRSSVMMSDGYDHVIYVHRKLGQAWIYRSGGLSGVSHWFGPMTVDASKFEGCASQTPLFLPPR